MRHLYPPFASPPAFCCLCHQIESTTLEQLGTARKLTVANSNTTLIADQVRGGGAVACPSVALGSVEAARQAAGAAARTRSKCALPDRSLVRWLNGRFIHSFIHLSLVGWLAGQQGRDQGAHCPDQEGAGGDRLWWVGAAPPPALPPVMRPLFCRGPPPGGPFALPLHPGRPPAATLVHACFHPHLFLLDHPWHCSVRH